MLSVFAAALVAGVFVYDQPAEIQPIPDPIDFAHLNSQAVAALRSLQAAQAQRAGPPTEGSVPVLAQ